MGRQKMSKEKLTLDISKLREGDKLLVHSKGFWQFVSKSIRVITHSYWNHVGDIVIKDRKIYVVEALASGVVLSPIKKYQDTKKYDVRIARLRENLFESEEDYRVGLLVNTTRVLVTVGKKYDFGAIVGMGIKIPIRGLLNCIPFIKKIPQINANLLQFRSRVFCSENVCECAYSLRNAEVKNPFENNHKGQACSITTPGDVYKSKYTLIYDFYKAKQKKKIG